MSIEPPYRLIDGFERCSQHSETFEFPGFDAISRLRNGDFAKIGVEFSPDPETGHDGERFWVKIVSAFEPETATCFTGIIDNNLCCGAIHGLQFGDFVCFEPNNVLAIAQKTVV